MINSWLPSHIHVTVHQAKDLALKSKSLHSEIYVTIQLDQEKKSTNPVSRDTHPKWEESFDISLTSLNATLDLTVRQKSKFTDEYIGTLTIPFNSLTISKRVTQNWYKLGPRAGKTSTKLRGDLLISTSFIDNWDNSINTDQIFDTEFSTDSYDKHYNNIMMLRRTKSEIKPRPKDSPRLDKTKPKGLFNRSKKKNSKVFEDCDDDFVAMAIEGVGFPPTPPRSEQRKKFDDQSHDSSEDSLDFMKLGGVRTSMFAEATQLERNGIIDLWKADPQTRLEQGKKLFLEGINRDNSKADEKQTTPPSATPPSTRSSLSLNFNTLQTRKASSLESSLENDNTAEDDRTKPPASSTPLCTPDSPQRHNTITYRAKSIHRRKDRRSPTTPTTTTPTASNPSLSHQSSITSIDGESITSEYYSGSSAVNTPSTSVNLVSEVATPTSSSCDVSKEEVRKSPPIQQTPPAQSTPPVQRTLDTVTGQVHNGASKGGVATPKRRIRRGQSVDVTTSTSSHPSLPRYRKHPEGVAKTRHLHPNDNVQLRRKKSFETGEIGVAKKRHSADVSSSFLSSNDGLDNVLPTSKLRQLLAKNHTHVNRHSPILGNHAPTNHAPANHAPPTKAPTTDEQQESPLQLPDVTPVTVSTDDTRKMEQLTPQESPLKQPDTPPAEATDISSLTTAGTCNGVLPYYVVADNNQSCSTSTRSSTPSPTLPLASSTDVTRESTPEADGDGHVNNEKKIVVKHTVEMNEEKRIGFEPISPLPPSIKSNSLPRRYCSTSDISSMAASLPPPFINEVVNHASMRPSSQCGYSHSATSSGRTSPVIEEEATPTTTPPASTEGHTPTTPNRQKPVYESSSLQRRRPQGSGLKRAITMYSENKRQQVTTKSTRERNPVTQSKSFSQNRNSPLNDKVKITSPSKLSQQRSTTTTTTTTEKPTSPLTTPPSIPKSPSKSHEYQHTIQSQRRTSSETPSPTGTPVGHFALPPPPIVQHTYIAGQVSGLSPSIQPTAERSSQESERINVSTTPSLAGSSSMSDIHTTSCSETEDDSVGNDYLLQWSKEELIAEVLRLKSKEKSIKQELADTKGYLETLLVKVMDNNPELLLLAS